MHPVVGKFIKMFRKPGYHYNGSGNGKSLELSTSYSYSNGYPPSSTVGAPVQNTGLNGTYTKRSSSWSRNLDDGAEKNGKFLKHGYINNGFKDT